MLKQTVSFVSAGFYPSILRVDHPAARYTKMHSGTFEVDADPSELRFYDKLKGDILNMASKSIAAVNDYWQSASPLLYLIGTVKAYNVFE